MYYYVFVHLHMRGMYQKILNNATAGAQRGTRVSRKRRPFEDYSPFCDMEERTIGFPIGSCRETRFLP